jgi:uncharacterized OsmC-like protein
VELDDGVLIVKRIHVDYDLQLDPGEAEAAERAHRLHVDHCPVAQTIIGCVDITTALHAVPIEA